MKQIYTGFILFFLFGNLPGLQAQDYTPIQVESKRWIKDKPNVPWEKFDTRIIDNMTGFVPKRKVKVHPYGSDLSKKYKATGFFRVEKQNGRWWIIDPSGYRSFQLVINSIQPGQSERNVAAFEKKFGTYPKWMQVTADSLYHYGFNGSGSWSRTESIIEHNKTGKNPLTYTPNLNFMSSYGRKRGGTYQLPGNTGYPNQCIFVFDPEFETFCDEHARQVLKYKNDKNLFGFFSDNEMPLGMNNLQGYLTLPNKEDPGYLAAKQWLKDKGLTEDMITDVHREEFAGYVTERYYSIVSKALKKYAPNHLFLGSRLHGGSKNVKAIVHAAGKYCDIVSFNYYGVWTPQPEVLAMWEEVSARPFMITEFYTKAMDAGLANTTGAGFTVRTQRDKGYAYQHFCLALLESKACVGWHYFKYQDNDPTAKGVDPSNIDSNKGIVNNDFDYYHPLMELMGQLNRNVFGLIDYFD
ncbi:hypothetical protein FACS1894182_05880 [Bacteroidia bacterium]|nr:hypothetical protein FACS1894182_05880 [Bacteroidia bacterium]